ncbi:hypothetical protein JCM24511_10169 [Saitozyma sp. JCM 24511]|nr:hypothetical protein JCM24511_10169 [Saitozyma sp. JCM 24511]
MLKLIEERWYSLTTEERETLAPALLAMAEVVETEAWPNRDIPALFLGDLWALEANAQNGEATQGFDSDVNIVLAGAFWTIPEILQHTHILPSL